MRVMRIAAVNADASKYRATLLATTSASTPRMHSSSYSRPVPNSATLSLFARSDALMAHVAKSSIVHSVCKLLSQWTAQLRAEPDTDPPGDVSGLLATLSDLSGLKKRAQSRMGRRGGGVGGDGSQRDRSLAFSAS